MRAIAPLRLAAIAALGACASLHAQTADAPASPGAVPSAEAPSSPEERAAAEADAKRKLEALRTELRALEAEREAARGERATTTAQLREADVALGEVAREKAELDAKIEALDAKLESLVADATALEKTLAERRDEIARLVRSAYVLGRHGELKAIFAPEAVATTQRRLAYLAYVKRHRATLLGAVANDLRALAEVRRETDAARLALAESIAALETRKAALDVERADRERVLADIEAKLVDQSARLAAIGKDEKALLTLIDRLRDAIADIPKVLEGSEPFTSHRGRLRWPVANGKVLAGYGSTNADGRVTEGLLIGDDTGARVTAVSHGRVAYADWLKGYGLLVIVEHGDGWMSLYAHNESLLADVGEWVSTGDPIATVGASGGSAQPGVYFELRRDGRPVDPAGWLAKR